MTLLKLVHEALFTLLKVERRFDPFFRPAFDALFQEPLARFIQALINLRRQDEGLQLAEEKPLPGEAAFDMIIAEMAAYMRDYYTPGTYERAGNTKTHGVVRANFIVSGDTVQNFAKASFPSRVLFQPGFASPDQAPPHRRT